MKECIKVVIKSDIEILAKLAKELWTEQSLEELMIEFTELVASDNTYIVIKYIEDMAIGFAQCQLRNDYVEGTNTTPVGYLEGIYIKPEFRHNGYASELLKKCEIWIKNKGCVEFASDCELNNEQSLKFHLAYGFKEVNRVICFNKIIKT